MVKHQHVLVSVMKGSGEHPTYISFVLEIVTFCGAADNWLLANDKGP